MLKIPELFLTLIWTNASVNDPVSFASFFGNANATSICNIFGAHQVYPYAEAFVRSIILGHYLVMECTVFTPPIQASNSGTKTTVAQLLGDFPHLFDMSHFSKYYHQQIDIVGAHMMIVLQEAVCKHHTRVAAFHSTVADIQRSPYASAILGVPVVVSTSSRRTFCPSRTGGIRHAPPTSRTINQAPRAIKQVTPTSHHRFSGLVHETFNGSVKHPTRDDNVGNLSSGNESSDPCGDIGGNDFDEVFDMFGDDIGGDSGKSGDSLDKVDSGFGNNDDFDDVGFEDNGCNDGDYGGDDKNGGKKGGGGENVFGGIGQEDNCDGEQDLENHSGDLELILADIKTILEDMEKILADYGGSIVDFGVMSVDGGADGARIGSDAEENGVFDGLSSSGRQQIFFGEVVKRGEMYEAPKIKDGTEPQRKSTRYKK